MRLSATQWLCMVWCMALPWHPLDKDIAVAVKALRLQSDQLKAWSAAYPVNRQEALSIVFPEVIRYNYFKDFFETQSLEWGYVQKGSHFVDFSIGLFQMKPSFIEQLEAAILAQPDALAAFQPLAHYRAGLSPEAQRQERLGRLKSTENQVRYACAFWAVCQQKFQQSSFPTRSAAVCFYAAAYNFGFNKTPAAIAAWMPQKAFPYGQNMGDQQMAYGTLAVYFYEKESYFLK